MKHLHKFYNHDDVPWVSLIWDAYYHHLIPHKTQACGSFWWKDVFKGADKYCALANPTIGCGMSISLGDDAWILDGAGKLVVRFPHVHSLSVD